MYTPEPALIGVVITPSNDMTGHTVAWVAISNKNCLPSGGRRDGYIYGVMETLFSQHPLFNTSKCCWREAEPEDEIVWKNSCWPTIYVY